MFVLVSIRLIIEWRQIRVTFRMVLYVLIEYDLVQLTLHLNRYIERSFNPTDREAESWRRLEREGKRTHFGLEKGMRLVRRKRLAKRKRLNRTEQA